VVLLAFTAAGIFSLQDDVDGLLRELPRSALHLRDMIRSVTNDRAGWWQRLTLQGGRRSQAGAALVVAAVGALAASTLASAQGLDLSGLSLEELGNIEVTSVVPEDVERIEVISGPGATLWGANAVNGIINIITRSSQETRARWWRRAAAISSAAPWSATAVGAG
jgi:hypothetical protein